MNILDVLKEMGITDLSVLPGKTQRKLKDYNKNLNSAIGKNKATGKMHPGMQQRLDDLAEDIILEAKLFIKKSQEPPAKTQAEIDAEEAEKKRLDDEAEKKRLDDEAEQKRLADEQVAKNKKGKGFANWLFED